MTTIVREETEIFEILDKCSEADEEGSKYPGMSYEDGIKAAINWLTDLSSESPFDED